MASCWSCDAPTGEDTAFCGCGAIQPPDLRLDHFAVLGVPARFELDGVELERRYKELTRKLHPDRFAKADPRARRYSLERATQVNDAYQVLRQPVRRAEYLLKLQGLGESEGEEKQSKAVDPAFLMEIMEEREALAEARAEGDAARLGEMRKDVQTKWQTAMTAVREGLERGAYEAAYKALGTLRYYQRFIDELDAHDEEAQHG